MIAESSAGESKGTEPGAPVPAFNEEQGIAAFLQLRFGLLRSCCTRFEEWMRDDGSKAKVGARRGKVVVGFESDLCDFEPGKRMTPGVWALVVVKHGDPQLAPRKRVR